MEQTSPQLHIWQDLLERLPSRLFKVHDDGLDVLIRKKIKKLLENLDVVAGAPARHDSKGQRYHLSILIGTHEGMNRQKLVEWGLNNLKRPIYEPLSTRS